MFFNHYLWTDELCGEMLEKGKEFGERAVQLHHPLPVGRWQLLSIYCELSVCVRQSKGIGMQCLSHPEKYKGTGTESDWLLSSCRGERCMGVAGVILQWWKVWLLARGRSQKRASSDVFLMSCSKGLWRGSSNLDIKFGGSGRMLRVREIVLDIFGLRTFYALIDNWGAWIVLVDGVDSYQFSLYWNKLEQF